MCPNLMDLFEMSRISALFDYRDMQNEMPEKLPDGYVFDSVSLVSKLESPRFIKTHIPWQMLPKQLTDGDNKPKVRWLTVTLGLLAKHNTVSFSKNF